MESESLSFPEARLVDIEAYNELDFRCLTGRVKNGCDAIAKPFRVVAIAKVPDGVRYLSTRLAALQTPPNLKTMCLMHGDFGSRPYTLAQESDACSRVCALALLHAYCLETNLDPQRLILRAYPYDLVGPTPWRHERWSRIREEAAWQRVLCPCQWNPDELIDLLVTLIHHDLRALADALLMEIGSGRRSS